LLNEGKTLPSLKPEGVKVGQNVVVCYWWDWGVMIPPEMPILARSSQSVAICGNSGPESTRTGAGDGADLQVKLSRPAQHAGRLILLRS